MTPKSLEVADQVRELGLQLGDMIEGHEGDHGVRLVLKFLGAEVAVFDEWMHVDDGTWRYLGESAEWDLSCRDWVPVDAESESAGYQVGAVRWHGTLITGRGGVEWLVQEVSGDQIPPGNLQPCDMIPCEDMQLVLRWDAAASALSGRWEPAKDKAEKAAATDAQIDALLAHPDWIARLRDLLADLPATEAQRRALQCIRDEDMTRWDDACDRAVVAALEIAAHCAQHAGGQPVTVPAIPTTCRCGGCTDSRCPRRQGDPA